MVTLVANAAAVLFIMARFIPIFEDFDTDLPSLTHALIEWRYAIGALSIALAILMLCKEVLIRHPTIKLTINLLVSLATLGLVPLTIFAKFMPLVALMQSSM